MPEGFDLNALGLRTTGRAKAPLVADVVRELDPDDIAALQTEKGYAPQAIKRLRERHHALAKALVDGIPEGEAAIICGYTANRVSILKADPSFQELMKFYQSGKQERYLELHQKLANLGTDAVEELTSRLEDEPEEVSIGQLLEISKMALDRSGHGPQTNTNVNVKVGLADKLEAARKRALQHRSDAMIEARAVDVTPQEQD